jgi:N-acetylmuramoyl-L-alanine amidase.
MELWYPNAVKKPLTGPAWSDRKGTRIIGFVPHVQVGHNSLRDYFSNTKNEASSHLWLSYTGVFEQYIPFDLAAWTQAAGNKAWVTCECEGFPNEPYTDQQLNRLAEFFKWGATNFGWKLQITDNPNVGGLGTHVMGGTAWGGHSCPGTIRAGQRLEVLRRAQAGGVTPTGGVSMPLNPDDKKWLLSPEFMFPVYNGVWKYPSPVNDKETMESVMKTLVTTLVSIDKKLSEILDNVRK